MSLGEEFSDISDFDVKTLSIDYSFHEDVHIDGTRLFDSFEFIAKPIKSESCTIDENIIQLHHSFGYDCFSKMFNLCAADEHTVVYAAGSYIIMLDINNGTLRFRKCAGNGGIGHITKNPVSSHIAVGEKCNDPLILVYEWPTFQVISVLRGSTKKQINWMCYSENGEYLCSQGGEPDYTLTIWDWKTSKIVLRTKSHTQDVYICRFSNFIPHHIVTAGSGHIKFWKMANTFTGLKLKGQLGRFGKTEISNVIGIFSMPNEKVISGCEWGNILVWDEELIDVQVTRKGRQPCHLAPIIMFLYSEQNMKLTSISMDGMIKFWNYRTVDQANPPENDRFIEIEPSFTIKVQDSINEAKIMGMCKTNGDSNSYDYFIQDGNGGLWLADMKAAETADAKPPKRLVKFHGDTITSLLVSPFGYFIATTSLDGWFHVYDVVNKMLIFMQDLKEPITSLVWLPLKIASSGNCFVIGFKTGILKVVAVPLKENMREETMSLTEIQSSKPHTDSIGRLTVNHDGNVLVCGSDDSTIFAYKVETKPIKLNPIGMFPLPGKVTFIHWKISEKRTALVSCASGHVVEVRIPPARPVYTKRSYLLDAETRVIATASVKSEIARERHASDVARRKRIKADGRKAKLAAARADNPGAEVDEELEYLEDTDEDEEPPGVYVPPVPNPVLFAVYAPSGNTVWTSVDGYDAGYLYEYDFDAPKPIAAVPIPDKNDTPLTAIETNGFVDSSKILMGFDDGTVRITNFNVYDPSDLSDYIEYSIHDNQTGRVKMLCMSEDNRMMYTYGDDGNIFSFTFLCDNSAVEKCLISTSNLPKSIKLSEKDIIQTKEDLKMSLEERKIVKEKRKALHLANKEKEKINCFLYCLKEKYKQVLIKNQALPESIRLPDDYFQFDEQINRSLIKEAQSKMDQLKLKFAFDYEKSALGLKKLKNYFIDEVITAKFEVKAILTDIGVKTIQHIMRRNYIFGSLLEKFLSKKRPKRQRRKSTVLDKSTVDQHHTVTEKEVFLRNVREIYQSLPKKIQVAIDKFIARSDFETTEILKIKQMHQEKTYFSNVEEEATLNHARETIGDFNLKTASNFIPTDDEVISMEDKFDQYTDVQEEISSLKSTFNEKVFDLRQRKINLINDYKQFKFDVHTIQIELNDPEVITPLDFPEVVVDKSIDPILVDSLKSDHCKDIMYWDHFENNYLYSETSEKEFRYEEPSCLDIKIKEMRQDELKYRHLCLHESMLTKINMFDCHLSKLNVLRRDVVLHVTFLDLFAIQLEEELIILNEFDLIEDEYLYNVYVKTGVQNIKADQIQRIREDIAYYKSIIEKKSNQLIDIEYLFDVEIRNNDFAKHLKKIFKKKLKIPKVKTDGDDESSSSSDDSDESSDSESLKSIESLMDTNQLAMFDENILPEGCDPKLFALTFELRSKRQEIEQYIESVSKKVEISNSSFNSAHAEFEIIENDLKQTLSELEAYRIKKQLALNDVETTVVLRISQMAKAKMLKKSILVYGNVMQDLAKRVTELKKESEAIKNDYEEEKLLARKLRADIVTLRNVIKKLKLDIKDEMLKKFKIEKNWKFLDDMEMTIINYMIILAKSSVDRTKTRYVKEVNMIKNKIKAHQEILIDLLGSSTVKSMILRAFHKGVAQIQQSLSIQQKNNEKVRSLSVNCDTSDVASLEEIYEQLSKQKIDIVKKIKGIKKCEIYLELFKWMFRDKKFTTRV